MSDVLYGKKPKKATSTVTGSSMNTDPNFDIGSLTQVNQGNHPENEHSNVVNLPKVHINKPVLKFLEIPIIVNPVINFNTKELKWDAEGQLLVPEIKVELTININ